MTISIKVNGTSHEVDDEHGATSLLDFLQSELDLTGTKFCCGIGVCRACTVAVRRSNGPASPVISCSTPLRLLHDAEVTTVEGLADGDLLHPLQTAFLGSFAFQCGYCTPGFLMAAKVMLDRIEAGSFDEATLDDALAEALGSHICRCTGYVRYFEAVKSVALDAIAKRRSIE